MDSEVKVPLKVIQVWNKRAILTHATKRFKCAASGLPIEKGEDYYCVYICGAGLRNKIYPTRVRVEYINDYLNFGGKHE